jgi:hypothetical protein
MTAVEAGHWSFDGRQGHAEERAACRDLLDLFAGRAED